MSKGKYGSQFLLLLVLSATLIVSVIVVQQAKSLNPKAQAASGGLFTETFSLIPSWNLITFSVNPNLTTSTLCNKLPNTLEASIHKFQTDTGYVNYYCYDQSSNPAFDIRPYEGYFIFVADSYDLTVAGKRVDPILSLDEGWTTIGFPLTSKSKTNASNFCGKYAQSRVNIVEIDKWENGGWTAHMCDLPLNDFEINQKEGYFVKTELISKPGSQKKNKTPSKPNRP